MHHDTALGSVSPRLCTAEHYFTTPLLRCAGQCLYRASHRDAFAPPCFIALNVTPPYHAFTRPSAAAPRRCHARRCGTTPLLCTTQLYLRFTVLNTAQAPPHIASLGSAPLRRYCTLLHSALFCFAPPCLCRTASHYALAKFRSAALRPRCALPHGALPLLCQASPYVTFA